VPQTNAPTKQYGRMPILKPLEANRKNRRTSRPQIPQRNNILIVIERTPSIRFLSPADIPRAAKKTTVHTLMITKAAGPCSLVNVPSDRRIQAPPPVIPAKRATAISPAWTSFISVPRAPSDFRKLWPEFIPSYRRSTIEFMSCSTQCPINWHRRIREL
jgi:hypothetical protein